MLIEHKKEQVKYNWRKTLGEKQGDLEKIIFFYNFKNTFHTDSVLVL